MNWIKISNKLPRKEERVIAYSPKLGVLSAAIHLSVTGKWMYSSYGKPVHESNVITHWMPMPKPPKTVGNEKKIIHLYHLYLDIRSAKLRYFINKYDDSSKSYHLYGYKEATQNPEFFISLRNDDEKQGLSVPTCFELKNNTLLFYAIVTTGSIPNTMVIKQGFELPLSAIEKKYRKNIVDIFANKKLQTSGDFYLDLIDHHTIAKF